MPPDRTLVTAGLLSELGRLEKLVRSLDADAWARPTRCDEWTVGDIARHVIGNIAEIAAGRFDGLRTGRAVAERQGRSPGELADECAAVRARASRLLAALDDDAWQASSPGTFDGSIGDAVETLWSDAWIHADDIRAALGVGTVIDGIEGALGHVTFELHKGGWAGATPRPTDDAAVGWVLAATGRAPRRDDLPNIYDQPKNRRG